VSVPAPQTDPGGANEVARLIESVHAGLLRLEQLTGGEVDTVATPDGRSFLMPHAQEQLRDSEAARQSAILNALPAQIALLDVQGRIISVNQTWRSSAVRYCLGSPDYGIGLNYPELCDAARGPDSAEGTAVAAGIRALLAGDSATFAIEYPCHSSSEQRWFRLSVTPLAGQPPTGAVVMHVDITEQKQIDDALRRQQTELRALFDLLPAMIWFKDTENRILRVNKQVASAAGRAVSEIEGRATVEIYPAEAAQYHADDLTVIQSRVPKLGIVERLATVDGGESWVQTDKVPVCDTDGKVIGIFVMAQDITARMNSEKALRDSERRFSDLLNNVELAAVMLDGAGLITYCNDYLLRLSGWKIEEVIGKDWFVLFAPPVLGDLKTTFRALLADRSDAREAEGEIFTRSGERRLIRWSNSVLRSPGGAVTGTASIGEDITQRRLIATRLRRLNRVYGMLSGISSLIVRVNERDELFKGACSIAMTQGLFKMAWIGRVDKSTQLIVPVAAEGADADLLALVDGRSSLLDAIALNGTSMTARAVREQRAIVTNEIAGDTTMVLNPARLDRGIVSMAILPLIVAGTAVGVFVLYAAETGFFDDEEMKLLTELAHDIAFGVDHIEKQERLDYLAYYDVLTGLANRRLFLERVAQYTRSATTGNHELAVCVFDLERFKNVNDSLGQPAGDELLRQVATWLTVNVADASLFARVDADHFAMVLPKIATEGDAARLIEKSLAAFVEHSFQLNDTVLRVAAKVGVALFPEDGSDAATLFTNAELALKRAKASGNRYMMFAQKMTEAVAGRLTLDNQLRDALRNGEFVLHYQPKVSLATGRVTGAEALLRWNNPRTGLVPPGHFIPALEETGLILDVGAWALRQALSDHQRWTALGLEAVRIAVNVSPLQLRQPEFIGLIEQLIGAGRQHAAALELELTEGLLMEDINHSVTNLQAIRELGVTIAIDDFGTGFSSLSYLTRLPIDTIKIDGSFVANMTSSSKGLALVSTIIGLGHSLRLKVVAEGVETEEQSRLLRLLNCDEMQGYLYSRPLATQAFEANHLAQCAAHAAAGGAGQRAR
jgi:diguanylate cyclase (GGDEF)-like protein/PAS domain S-box-containing protein